MAESNSFFADSSIRTQPAGPGIVEPGQLSRVDFLQLSASLNRITANEQPGSFLPELLQTAIEIVGGECGFLLSLEENREWLIRQAYRRNGILFSPVSESIADELVQEVLTTGKPVQGKHSDIIDDLAAGVLTRPPKTRSVICVPLKNNSQVCGAIYVDSPIAIHLFNRHHLLLLATLAELAVIIRSNVSPLSELAPAESSSLVKEDLRLKQLYSSFIDSVPAPLLIVNDNGEAVLCNRSYRAHPVFSNPALVEPWQTICRGLEYSETGEYLPFDVEFANRHFRLSTFPTVSGYRGVIIHELVQRCNSCDRDSHTVIAQLSGGVAHEIKNALAPAMGRLQLLENILTGYPETIASQSGKQIVIIQSQLDRIARIAGSLSDLSRPQRLNVETIDLFDLVESTLELMHTTAGKIEHFARSPQEQSDYYLLTEYSSDLPTVSGDRDQLQQMLSNLLINAVHAVEEKNAGAICIEVHQHKLSEVEIVISDTGVGIDRRMQEKIWDPWFTTKTRDRGSGLGMMIIKTIVESHHGRIWLNSWPGSGTKIHVVLPIIDS
ncbi:MAG: GAF domain-containing protein [Candidatus Delongbacteria bacterium]|nr:GAF domain-containing protein [Candidatus Delongbacteria bacterium]